MAPPTHFLSSFPIPKVLLVVLHLFLLSPLLASSLSASSGNAQTQVPQIPNTQILLGRRTLLAKTLLKQQVQDVDDDDDDKEAPPLPKKKKVPKPAQDEDDDESLAFPKKKNKKTDEQVLPNKKKTQEDEEASTKQKKLEKDAKLIKSKTNSTKLIKPSTSSKNQTKLIKPIGGLGLSSSGSSKNKTKLIKTTTTSKHVDVDDSTSSSKSNSPNLTKTMLKKLNSTSTKKSSNSTKSSINTKSLDPIKSKTTKPKSQSSSSTTTTAADKKKKAPPSPASWMYDVAGDDDFVSEFRDLPTKFQQTFIPDLHRISATSQRYLTRANKEMTKGFKPYVGNKYAPSVATAIGVAFIIVPLLLVSLIFNKIKAYFSLQRLVIFIQIYLAIYFSILSMSSLLTGLEPLRFFYATSQYTYVWIQVLQTLGYVLYLLLLLMYLVLVFSTETNLGQKFLGLAQTFVGFAVGLHYYVTVFHRVVLRQPPKTNWKVHGIYATCFLVICLFAQAERRKKAYLVEGGEEGKKS